MPGLSEVPLEGSLPSAPKDFPPVWVKPPLASAFVPIPEDPPESTDLLTISSPQRLFKVC